MLFRPLSLRLDDVRQSAPHANSSKSKQGVDRKRKSQSRERKRVIAPPDCPPPGAGTILAVFGNLRSLFSDPTAPPPAHSFCPVDLWRAIAPATSLLVFTTLTGQLPACCQDLASRI